MSDSNRVEPNKNPRALRFFLVISIFEGFISLVLTLSIRPDPKNAFFLGFSLSRLAILFILLVILGALIFFPSQVCKKPGINLKST